MASSSSSPSTMPSARFVSSSSDFHLPQRPQTPTTSYTSVFASSTLVSPKSAPSLGTVGTDETAQGSSFNALPLLRRKAAAAALAHATRKGLRRGSMLGKEVAKKDVEQESESDEEEEEDEDMESEMNDKSRSPSSPVDAKDEDEEMMHVDAGDDSIFPGGGVELEGKTRSGSPSPSAQSGHRAGASTTNAARRVVQRRANLLPRDRGVLRVAASLRDETRPAEGEIASEAKLQRRLGPDSDSYTPTTPKLVARRSQSPYGPPSAGGIDRGLDGGDDYYFAETAHFDMSDDSDYNGDDDMAYNAKSAATPDVDTPGESAAEQGIAIPGSHNAAAQKEKLWLSFRQGNPRLSPGVERSTGRGVRMGSAAPMGGAAASVSSAAALSFSLGSVHDQTMETDMLNNTGSSPSLWGRSAKRKIVDDRYEPYYASAIYKRRAVSPVAFVSSNNSGGNNSSTNHGGAKGSSSAAAAATTLSPGLTGLSQVSPLFIQAPFCSALPTPTPLSIPSPTMSLSRMPGSGASRVLASSVPANMTTSTNASPSSTRPSTPTNPVPPGMFGALPSPSLLSSSASKVMAMGGGATGAGGNAGGNGVGGSGPGYGSGALGLSLGGGSKRYKQEQQEMEEEEGMLGDVSAIRL